MTRDEIIAKWAGLSTRERDAWVEAAVLPISEEEARDRRKFSLPRPHYTTEISAAWALVDKSAEYGGMSVSFTCSRNGARRYTVETYAGGCIFVVAAESTAPAAICLAAIIAKLTEVSADVAV